MYLHPILVLGLCLWGIFGVSMASGNVFFKVEHKFKGGIRDLKVLREHDARRHGRMLGSIDLSLGGIALPSDVGLYYTKIQLGNPSHDYHVQVDTGSDILWVNCAGCDNCPKRSEIGIKLSLYDPKGSSTAKPVYCGDKRCTMIYQGILDGCQSDVLCPYQVTYEDDSVTSGYFVEDTYHYDQVSGNQQTTSGNASIFFGCGAKQSGLLSTDDAAVDGLIGFGQTNSSVISQLAAAGKVKKMFSHCLDNMNGGGIFAIGQLVEPKLNTTPLIPNQTYYNVEVKRVEVGGDVLEISTAWSHGETGGAIIDSGTTLAYLPDDVFNAIMKKILAQKPDLKLHTVQDQFKCFQYSGDLDKTFPEVAFHFESLNLTVYPHDYLFPLNDVRDQKWCIGWMNGGFQSPDGNNVAILGDFVLANRLVFYDLENQAIGWTPYNCSSSIKVKDVTGATYTIGAHNISSAKSSISRGFLFLVCSVIINLQFFVF